MNSRPPKLMAFVENADYYKILGVSKDASQDDLKNAYREAARKYHPDKGGDPEKFKELAQAYGVLRDPERRQIYNIRRQDQVCYLKVSLEDLYNGASKMCRFRRPAICSKCKGKGSKSGVPIICSACKGSGMMPYTRHFIPGALHSCCQCKGTGETLLETITDKDRCEQCKGEKIVNVESEFEVNVEKGMQNGQKITFSRREFPTLKGGGIIFILQENEHPKFKRKGDDLFVEHTVSFVEALSGFQFGLTHLDKRQLIIKSKPGEVVKPGQFKAISDEGMPMYEKPSMKGKLYIHFTVEFPDALTPDLIKDILTPRPSPQPTHTDVDKDFTLHDVNQKQAQEAYDAMHFEMKMKAAMPEGAMRKGETGAMMKMKAMPGEGAKRKRKRKRLQLPQRDTTLRDPRLNELFQKAMLKRKDRLDEIAKIEEEEYAKRIMLKRKERLDKIAKIEEE